MVRPQLMNRLKSAFISTFITVAVVTMALGAHRMSLGAYLAGACALVGGAVWATYFAWLYLRPVARNHPTLPVQQVVAYACAGIAPFAGDPLTMVLTAVTALGGTGYVFWYSRLARAPSRLSVGEALPAFVLRDGEAEITALVHPALMVFYRGNWCPLCQAQVREVAGQYQALAERGVSVNLISPQSARHTASLAKRFDAPMRFLVDPGSRAAAAFGIMHPAGLPTGLEALGFEGDTVLPTVVITDADGVVRWTHETDNYRIRPEPDVFLRALDELGI